MFFSLRPDTVEVIALSRAVGLAVLACLVISGAARPGGRLGGEAGGEPTHRRRDG